MRITVAIATRGRPDALARCVDAVARQTRPADEVIVVDQAPSEKAREVTLTGGLPAGRYIEQEPRGLSASRNLALAEAGGAVLAVTDDDCAPDRAWLEAVAGAFERANRPAGVTGPVLPLGDRPPGMFPVSVRDSNISIDHSGRVLPWVVGSGGNFAGLVSVLRDCGGWDERLGAGSGGQAAEDTDLLYRLLLRGVTIRYDAGALVRHEWQTASRRRATRWSYGFGIGAMCGIWLRQGDAYAVRMLAGFVRLHGRPLLGGVRHADARRVSEHARALTSLAPGLVYGMRVARQPATKTEVSAR